MSSVTAEDQAQRVHPTGRLLAGQTLAPVCPKANCECTGDAG